MTTFTKPEVSIKSIYRILKALFPNDFRVIIACITDIIHTDKNHPVQTLAIDYIGNLYINKDFWDKYVENDNDASVLLMHELMHQVINDTSFIKNLDPKDKELKIKKLAANIAMDCRINAYITRFSGIPKASELFKKIYTKETVDNAPINSLLSPGYAAKIPTERMKGIYDFLYSKECEDMYGFKQLYEEVLDYLRKNGDQEEDVILLGEHGEIPDTTQNSTPIPSVFKEQLKEAIKDFVKEHQVEDGEKKAGKAGSLQETILNEAIGIDQKLDFESFRALSFSSIMNNVRLTMLETTNEKSKSLFIPARMSRSDIFKMMQGYIPMSWDTLTPRAVKTPRKIPIYLDVSGSMWSELPVIIEMILNIRDDIEYVWGFSNEVHKHTMEDLRKKKIKSTGGTDFDCIIKHATDNDFRNILVITDGEASCSVSGGKLPQLDDVVTVLCTSYRCTNNYFCNTYKTIVQIEEITI